MSDVSEQIRLVGQEAIANQEVRFEEPIASLLQHIVAAKETLNNRIAALAEFQAAEKRYLPFVLSPLPSLSLFSLSSLPI